MSAEARGETALHATAVIFGEHGVLILGASGAGKSALALALLARARATNAFGALVGDDRVWVRPASGRLIARGAPTTAGIIERRMAGLVRVDCASGVVIRLVVDISEPGRDWPRLPDDPDHLMIAGVEAPRLRLSCGQRASDHAIAVEEQLSPMTNRRRGQIGISLEQSAAVHKNGTVAAPLWQVGRRGRGPVD
jgi:serine kinase of HPr protein (carbohydrate metabolism regulator)